MARPRRDTQEIIYFLANKYDLPLQEVKSMVDSQFKFIKEIIEEGEFDTIRLPYFGKFTVDLGRVKHINRLKSEKNIKKI
jgi:nucleoid DNA-binding protein